MKKFDAFRIVSGLYTATANIELIGRLPAGAYNLIYDGQTDTIYYNPIHVNHDAIVDLPSKEYDSVVRDLTYFLRPETKDLFDKYGFVYKRSSLLHGRPGTGKTVLVNRIIRETIAKGGIVLFNPNPQLMSKAYEQLEELQSDTMTMVVFEEIDEILKRYESDLLSILDGEIQKRNVIYMATTNYIDRIPARIMRPGRFSTVIEVKYPTPEAREVYLKNKLGQDFDTKEWVKKSEGLSIDELKETVVSVQCLSMNLDDVIKRIKQIKKEAGDLSDEENEYYELDFGESSVSFEALEGIRRDMHSPQRLARLAPKRK